MFQHPLEPFRRITAAEARTMLAGPQGEEVQVLDIQETGDYEACHIPGSHHIPFAWISERIGELDTARPIIVVCAVGTRSAFVAEMACTLGAELVYNLEAGLAGWRQAGYPLEQSDGTEPELRETQPAGRR